MGGEPDEDVPREIGSPPAWRHDQRDHPPLDLAVVIGIALIIVGGMLLLILLLA